jgi:hypothetical protein
LMDITEVIWHILHTQYHMIDLLASFITPNNAGIC